MFSWSPTYHLPLSGSINQDIETDWFSREIEPDCGNADIERQVFRDIATYGTQIGLLNQAILALAKELKPETLENIEALKELQAIQEKVKEIKEETKSKTRKKAKEILDQLAENEPEFLQELLEKYRNKTN